MATDMLHKKFDKILRNHLTCVTRCGIMGAAQAELVCKLKKHHVFTTLAHRHAHAYSQKKVVCLLLRRSGAEKKSKCE